MTTTRQVEGLATLEGFEPSISTLKGWRAIRRNANWITNDTFDDRADEHRWCLERISHYGGRLTALEPGQIRDLRREILRMTRPDPQRWLLNWLGNPRFCDSRVYDELARTPSMQAKMAELGLRTRLLMMRAARPPARQR